MRATRASFSSLAARASAAAETLAWRPARVSCAGRARTAVTALVAGPAAVLRSPVRLKRRRDHGPVKRSKPGTLRRWFAGRREALGAAVRCAQGEPVSSFSERAKIHGLRDAQATDRELAFSQAKRND